MSSIHFETKHPNIKSIIDGLSAVNKDNLADLSTAMVAKKNLRLIEEEKEE